LKEKIMVPTLRFLSITALLIAALPLLGSATGAPKAPAYGTEITIQPSGAGAFVLRAKVTDLASGQVIAGPSLKAPVGEASKTESTLEDGTIVVLSATVDNAKHSATYSVVVKKGGTVVSEHAANLAL
jgi:hypothetical protein